MYLFRTSASSESSDLMMLKVHFNSRRSSGLSARHWVDACRRFMQAKKKKKSAFPWSSGQKVYVQNTFDFYVVIAEAVKEETSNTVFARSHVWECCGGFCCRFTFFCLFFFLFFLKSREWRRRTSRSLSAVHKCKACSPPTPHLLYLQRTSCKTE